MCWKLNRLTILYMIFNNPKFDIEIWLEWFYLNREIGRILLTIMHKFYGLLLFTSRYFALGVSICFTVQEKFTLMETYTSPLSKPSHGQNFSWKNECYLHENKKLFSNQRPSLLLVLTQMPRGYYSYIYLKELGLRALAILSETVLSARSLQPWRELYC